jgi:hypothetical protein
MQRSKVEKILKLAKPRLSDGYGHGDFEFLCHAIHDTHRAGISIDDIHEVRVMIMDRIQPYSTVQTWLDYRIGQDKVRKAGYRVMQDYRHRWLDALIQEFSK